MRTLFGTLRLDSPPLVDLSLRAAVTATVDRCEARIYLAAVSRSFLAGSSPPVVSSLIGTTQ